MYDQADVFVLLSTVTLLASCGGGGNNSAVMMPAPFTSFSAVRSGQPLQASGISQTVSAATLTGTVQSTTVSAVDSANSSATLTYGTIPAMSAFSFSAPTSNVSFSGMNVQCTAGTGTCGGSSGGSQGVVINPLAPPSPALAWNYQSFGYWLVVGSSTSTIVGAMSFGSRTPVAGIPAGGIATYNGLSSGFYVNQAGAVFVHAANMQTTVDFGPARSVNFLTTNTTLSPINVAAPIAFPALDLTGNFTIMGGATQFSGSVSAPGTPTLTIGSLTGKFYGPTAQEVGGVFSLKAASGPQTMLGGFGGKQ